MSTKNGSKVPGAAGPAKKGETLEMEARKRIVPKVVPPREVPQAPTSEEEPENLRVVANRLFQEAKLHLEQSGNIKTTIKETVIENLGRMYEIILKLSEDRMQLKNKLHQMQQRTEEGTNRKEIMQEIMEQKAMVRETMEEVRTMRKEIGKIGEEAREHREREGPTYAEKAAMKCNPMPTGDPADLPIHSIVVSSTNAKDSSEDVINKIRTAVEAKSTGIRVDRVRKAKDQRVVIGCTNREDLEKVKGKLNAGQPDLTVEEKRNKDPLIIIKDVLEYNTDEDILNSIRVQNAHLVEHIKNDDYRAKVKYRRRARNRLESHVVLQVSPAIWRALTDAGRVHIDLQRVAVKDQTPLIQCSRCLGYGHGRKLCTETVDKCSHCAGPHFRAECPIRLAGGEPACHNCTLAKHDRVDHNTFDDICPVRKKWDRLARSSVAYC